MAKLIRIHTSRAFHRFGIKWEAEPVLVAVLAPGEVAPIEAQRSITVEQYAALCKERDRDPGCVLHVADPDEATLKAAAMLAEAQRVREDADRDTRNLDAVRVELETARRHLASLEGQREAVTRALAEAEERARLAEDKARAAEERLAKAEADRAALDEAKRRKAKVG